MIDQNAIQTALGRLIGWLETWRTASGGYNGFVVHRFVQKRMVQIHDTAWTQAAMIRGYYNLAAKSGEARWREALLLAADLQCSRFDPATGRYFFAGHEDDRYCSLVHCALANCALLTVLPQVDDERRQRYVEAVQRNTDEYILSRLWVESEGAFRFSEVDYQSLQEDRFVVNFNTMAVESLLRLAAVTGEARYRERALRVGEWLLAKWRHSQQQEAQGGADAGAPAKRPVPPGVLAYQYVPGQWQHDNGVTIYAGLALRGIRALYDATGGEEYGSMLRGVSGYLLAMRDPQTRLFYHTTRGREIEPYPQFIAGAGMTLVGLLEAGVVTGAAAVPEDTVQAILARSYTSGAVPSFFGKDRRLRGERGGVVWDDAVAAVNWNAQWFEYLTRLVEEPANLRVTEPVTTRVVSRWFVYQDSRRGVCLASWWPPASIGIYWARKRWSRALVWLRTEGLRVWLRERWRALRGVKGPTV